jgi:hypothetical protein
LTPRADDTWEVVVPHEILYVPSDIVVPLLAHQLAALTERAPAPPNHPQDEIEISRLLNTLLQPGGGP